MNSLSAIDELAVASRQLAAAGIDTPKLDARVLLARALGVRSDELLSSRTLDEDAYEILTRFIARRVAREPLAYIIGTKEFFSLDFDVGPGVLIPRPETETLVEEALLEYPEENTRLDVLDMGTGSGCLVVSFLNQRPGTRGVGVDVSPVACDWAMRNVVKHGVADRCRVEQQNWNVWGQFDVIFANPPYLKSEEFAEAEPEISRFEPESAFLGGCDGLAAYRELAPAAARALNPSGRAFIEIGKGQVTEVRAILAQSGLETRRVVPDLAGVPRCVIAARMA